MVRDGHFGFKDYFKSLCDTVEEGKDFYLLGSDFASYLEAQVMLQTNLLVQLFMLEMLSLELTEYDNRRPLIEHLLIKKSGPK